MKLYTEEQVRDIILMVFNPEAPVLYDDILKNITPIELPSDEEIRKIILRLKINDFCQVAAFVSGVNILKEQILNQNK